MKIFIYKLCVHWTMFRKNQEQVGSIPTIHNHIHLHFVKTCSSISIQNPWRCFWDLSRSPSFSFHSKPHNICQVWTCHQSTLQSIQSMKLYNQYVGTARYKILPIIWHCAPFCAHYFFFLRNMLLSHSFMHFFAICCHWDLHTFCHCLWRINYFWYPNFDV